MQYCDYLMEDSKFSNNRTIHIFQDALSTQTLSLCPFRKKFFLYSNQMAKNFYAVVFWYNELSFIHASN